LATTTRTRTAGWRRRRTWTTSSWRNSRPSCDEPRPCEASAGGHACGVGSWQEQGVALRVRARERVGIPGVSQRGARVNRQRRRLQELSARRLLEAVVT
jgi:hypothetical protein